MATDVRRDEEKEERWKYTIYLVEFPGRGHSDIGKTTFPVSELISYLVPEAQVLSHFIFGGEMTSCLQEMDTDDTQDPVSGQQARGVVSARNSLIPREAIPTGVSDEEINHTGASFLVTEGDLEDVESVASTACDPFWSPSIEKEALTLLHQIREITKHEDAQRRRILLAGYGFGGIVVKQAIILANTTPKYYDIAYNVSGLVFFSTPHRADEARGWEGVLLDMIQASEGRFPGRLSQTLSALTSSVSQLSHVFHKFAAKYPLINFIEEYGTITKKPVIGELGKFNNDFENVVLWQDTNFKTIMSCKVDEIGHLESLRTHFAPVRMWNDDVFFHMSGTTHNEMKNTYFDVLQTLSKSHWILHETRTLELYEDFITFKDIYGSLLRDVTLERVLDTRSIQVIGPAGCGKSAVLKLIVQEIKQKSSAIVLDSYLAPSEEAPTLYGLFVSFIHQILSQRPSVFYDVRNMMAEILLRDTWTENSLRIVFAALLHRCERARFLILVYDYENWPGEIRSWWSGELRQFFQSCGTSFTFVTSSRSRIENLSPAEPHELDLEKKHTKYRRNFVQAKLDRLLDHGSGYTVSGIGPTADLRNIITAAAEDFQGSFAAISAYLTVLSQGPPLTTAEAIGRHIKASPKTEEELYKLEISALRKNRVNAILWAESAISWTMWSARPLRLEELAAATAIDPQDNSLRDIKEKVSMDMAQDLERHLDSIIALENRQGCISSAAARDILATTPSEQLNLQDDYKLTKLCLHYLELLLTQTHNKIDDEPKAKETRAVTAIDDENADGDHMGTETKRPETTPKAMLHDTWARCLSHVSWKYQSHNHNEPVSGFLDYACRFWPAHFLRIKGPDKRLIDQVAEFLQASHGQRWFQIYLLCHGLSANPLCTNVEVGKTTATMVSVTEPESIETRRQSTTESEIQHLTSAETLGDRQQSAVRVACYLGLTPILPTLLGHSVSDSAMLDARRGCSERVVACLDASSPYHLSCAISNDDADLTKTLLERGQSETAKCYPLHKAALEGSLKTLMMLVGLLDNPAETNNDEETPLHMAAAGGSTSTILLLLGRDAFEHETREMMALDMLDKQNNKMQTPLIISAAMGHVDAIKLLLQCGADASIRDFTGKTALHYAILMAPAAVENLISPNLIEIRDDDGCTALHIAARSGNAHATSVVVDALQKWRLFEVVNCGDNDQKTPLQYAAESGHASIVEYLLRYEKNGNYQAAAESAATRGHLETVRLFTSEMTEGIMDHILVAASASGQLLIVQYLLVKGLISPDAEGDGRRPLCQASARGHIEVVHALLRSRATVNTADGQRKTPLHHAAENGMFTVAKALLDHQANVNAPDIDRKTPLHSAASKGKVSVIKLFLKCKAHVEACSRSRETPLHLAVRYPEAVKVLLEANAEPNVADTLGQTPLHMAAFSENPQSVQYLLQWKADVNARDDNGQFPLYYAITNDDLPTVKEFCRDHEDLANYLEDSATIKSSAVDSASLTVFKYLLGLARRTADTLHDFGTKLLHAAAAGESVEILNLLLQTGVDVDLQQNGTRALHLAAENGRLENIQKLLEYKAKVDARDDSGQTALHSAVRNGQSEAVEALMAAKTDINAQDHDSWTPIYIAAYYGYTESLKTLLQYEPDISIAADDGWTPLHAGADNLDITKLLVKAKANPNSPKSDKWTPLHLATYWVETEIVEFLLKNGGDPTLTTDNGSTALHLAVGEHSADMVTAMLDHGAVACINDRRKGGDTALHVALGCRQCNVEVPQLLIKYGADVDLRTSEQLSTLQLAIDGYDLEKLNLLLNTEVKSREDPNWHLADLIPAYWRAITTHCQIVAEELSRGVEEYPAIVKALVDKESRLLGESAEDGLNALEMCLLKHGTGCEEEPLALRLIELGINPLSRRCQDRKSALEFGILSRRSMKTRFLKCCVDAIPENATSLAALGLGFRELRIATELDKPNMWDKLKSLRDQVGVETDADGWRLDHFVHQSAGIPAPEKVPPFTDCRTPQGVVFPPQWALGEQKLGERLNIEDDKLTVVFSWTGQYDIVSLRANFPFLPRPINHEDDAIRYFEVKISTETKLENNIDSSPPPPAIIVIGFCGEFADLTNAHIGWNVWTVGYHGDDGMIFENRDIEYGDHDTKNKFGPGNTVGCGIDYSKKEYFFTLDGEVVARFQNNVIFRKLYPAISHRCGSCKVEVIFNAENCTWKRPRRKLARVLSQVR